MKAIIVDDDAICRHCLRGLLAKLGDTVVAEATNGRDAVAAVARTQPDLVLLDVSMPFQTGLEVLPAILAACPGVQVVMVTSVADQRTVQECLDKGAAGYVLKDAPLEEIRRLLVELRPEAPAPPNPPPTHAKP